MREKRAERALTGLTLVTAVLLVYLLVMSGTGLSLMKHSAYDSYTLQAMAWREGRVTVDQASHSWLELAEFEGAFYVSFPPFPSVVMFLLTFLWGANTPTLLTNLIMLLMTAGFAYSLLLRLKADPVQAAVISFFYVCGCNLWIIMLRGGVWYTAQGMSMLLTTVFFRSMTGAESGKGKGSVAAGLICLALAVGCRPFQAIYVPYGLFRLYRFARQKEEGFFRTLLRMIPYVLIPLLIAAAYGWYNLIRFGNPLEFGHNFLPEFTRAGNTQFSLSHWGKNLGNILRLPRLENGVLTFEMLGPSALLLLNPLYVICGIETVRRALRKAWDAEDWILLGSLLIHFNLLLLHRTLGGMQLGTRYMIDLMPALLLFTYRGGRKITRTDALLMLMGIGLNIYGSVVFFK